MAYPHMAYLLVSGGCHTHPDALRQSNPTHTDRDCIDVDVLPATTPVGTTSKEVYGGFGYDDSGEPGGGGPPPTIEYTMAKTDHCQYTSGRYTLFTNRADGDVGVCHPIPPPGATNSLGQGREAALTACHTRCLAGVDACSALNLVPLTPPPAALFGSTRSSLPVNGGAGCALADLAAEPAGTVRDLGHVARRSPQP